MAARVEYCNRLALVFSIPIFNNTRQWPMHRVRKQILAATHSSQSQSSRLSLSLSLISMGTCPRGPLKVLRVCVDNWPQDVAGAASRNKRFLATSSRNFTARMSEGGLRWVSSGLICGAAKIQWRHIYFQHGPHAIFNSFACFQRSSLSSSKARNS